MPLHVVASALNGMSSVVEYLARHIDASGALSMAAFCDSLRATIVETREPGRGDYLVLSRMLARQEHQDPPPFRPTVIQGGKQD